LDLLRIAQTSLLAALTVVTLIVGYEAIELSARLDRAINVYATLPASTNSTISQLNATVAEANQTLVQINRPCGGGHPCGTLADLNKTMATIRGTVGQIEIAANHEDRNLTTLDRQESVLFADAHQTLGNGAETLTAATAALGQAKETIGAAKPLLEASTASVKDMDAVVSDPGVKSTLANVSAMTENGNRISKDAADEADKLVHPPVKKLTFWGAIDGFFLWIHSHLMPSIF
jgi:hypothetical protein